MRWVLLWHVVVDGDAQAHTHTQHSQCGRCCGRWLSIRLPHALPIHHLVAIVGLIHSTHGPGQSANALRIAFLMCQQTDKHERDTSKEHGASVACVVAYIAPSFSVITINLRAHRTQAIRNERTARRVPVAHLHIQDANEYKIMHVRPLFAHEQ